MRYHIRILEPTGVRSVYDVGHRPPTVNRQNGSPPQYLEDYKEDYQDVVVVEHGGNDEEHQTVFN